MINLIFYLIFNSQKERIFMKNPLPQDSIEQLFTKARTFHSWKKDVTISSDVIEQLYNLAKMGPTSFNFSPARFVFITSQAMKEDIQPALMDSNKSQVLAAPLTVVVAHDLSFEQQAPTLAPHLSEEIRAFFRGHDNPQVVATAFRNGTLQGAYLIMAARALGLDCCPMSGFLHDKLDQILFPNTSWKSNFLCAIGVGDPDGLQPRASRLDFSTACKII